jgi:hypothetical protein
MKKKIIYMLAVFCCLSFYSSAKQVDKNCTKKCCVCKCGAKKTPAKAKKIAATSIRPFNFYLINI